MFHSQSIGITMEVASLSSHRSLSSFSCSPKFSCVTTSRVSSNNNQGGRRRSGGGSSSSTSATPLAASKRQTNLRIEQQRQLGSEQLLQFERDGHVCVPALFDGDEMAALASAVTDAARREKLNAYRHRVAVLCPGVDPFSLRSIADAEAVIRQQVVVVVVRNS